MHHLTHRRRLALALSPRNTAIMIRSTGRWTTQENQRRFSLRRWAF